VKKGVIMQEQWNVADRWYVSPYNFAEEVRSSHPNMPEKLTIRDVTLTEGQHQPGVRYTLDGMLKIAHALYDMGITEIKQGSQDFQALEFITQVKGEIPNVKIGLILSIVEGEEYRQSVSRTKQDMERYIDAGIDELNFPCSLSWSCPKAISDVMTREAQIERIVEMTQYARSQGISVEYGHIDATRAAFEDLKELFDNGLRAGMTRIGIYDSYGVASPDGMKFLVAKLRQEYQNVDILVHAHNDFGSAEATTIGGILGGGTTCELSVNGLGDRAGNASLEEVVLQLEAFYGIKTGLKLEKLVSLCKLVEEVTGIKVHSYKPIAGENVFTHESEAHAGFILQEGLSIKYASKSEAYSPEAVGGRRRVKFGGTSLTGGMIKQRIDQLGLHYGEKEIKEIRTRIKDIFVGQHRDISLEEFDTLAGEVCAQKD
jgi:isopropylmalate/homocitrate/citramalate synthase